MWQVLGPVRLPGPAGGGGCWPLVGRACLAGLGVSAGPLTKLGSRTVGGGARLFGSNVGLLVGGVSSYVAGSGAIVSGPGLA